MKFRAAELPGVILIEPDVFVDQRGFFMETWEMRKFSEAGLTPNFVQENHSHTHYGCLRGLHYQIKQPQGKLVRVILGEVFDVVVDLRRSSVTFGKWLGAILSDKNRLQLWVPPGFAHGFYVTSKAADFVYKCTDYYAPEYERTLAWNDPDVDIQWPLHVGQVPLLSNKDRVGTNLRAAETYP
jgi:dTDP-4-dehydrorhamnose 3,5-epimerase